MSPARRAAAPSLSNAYACRRNLRYRSCEPLTSRKRRKREVINREVVVMAFKRQSILQKAAPAGMCVRTPGRHAAISASGKRAISVKSPMRRVRGPARNASRAAAPKPISMEA